MFTFLYPTTWRPEHLAWLKMSKLRHCQPIYWRSPWRSEGSDTLDITAVIGSLRRSLRSMRMRHLRRDWGVAVEADNVIDIRTLSATSALHVDLPMCYLRSSHVVAIITTLMQAMTDRRWKTSRTVNTFLIDSSSPYSTISNSPIDLDLQLLRKIALPDCLHGLLPVPFLLS